MLKVSGQHTLRQRIEAAQKLGGYRNVGKLAEAAGVPGFGAQSIRRVMYGERELADHEAQALAHAAGLPVDFFAIDLAQLVPVEPPEDLAATIRKLTERVDNYELVFRGLTERLRDERNQTRAEILQRLDQLAQVVTRNAKAIDGLTVSTEQIVKDAMRGYGGQVVGRAGDADQGDQAAETPRDEVRAKTAAARARAQGKPGNAKRPAG